MKAMILCAGHGTRLNPLTDHTPKPMVPVMNRPILDYNLRYLKQFGVSDVVINLHHLGSQIPAFFGDGQTLGLRIQYSEEDTLLGTGGGLKTAQDLLDLEENETFILMNGDILVDIDLAPAFIFHERHEAAATMILTENAPLAQYGPVELDEDNNVRNIGGRLDDIKEAPRKKGVFTGIHLLTPTVFEYLPPFVQSCINAYGYPKMMANGETVKGLFLDGCWSDLGTVETYFMANMNFLERRQILSYTDPLEHFTLKPKLDQTELVVLGDNLDLGDGVQIRPPVLIGHNVKIGANTEIGPHVVLGDGVTVGKASRIMDAVVFPGTKLEAKARVLGEIVNQKARAVVPSSAITTQILNTDTRQGKKRKDTQEL